MASARVETDPFLFQVEKVREELKVNFFRSHQILQQREAALTSELDQLVANYRVEKIKEQMQDLDRMKETLKSTVQCEENKEIVVKSVAPINARIKELAVSLQEMLDKMCGVELDWDRELEEKLSEIGEIHVITAQTLKELTGSLKCALDNYGGQFCDVRVKGEYFTRNRDETRTVSFPHPKGECCVCYENDGLKMPCGHYICPDDILDSAWIQIKNLQHEFNCLQCKSILSIEDIIKFGLPTEEEKQFLMIALSVNFCESQDIVQCPNCSSYCQRVNSECRRMECTVCVSNARRNSVFCWYCLGEWKKANKYQNGCGNSSCDKPMIEVLWKCLTFQFTDIEGRKVLTPKIRACPQCFTLIEHMGCGSNNMTCICCHKMFCFICLKQAQGSGYICNSRSYISIMCNAAPVQTRLRK